MADGGFVLVHDQVDTIAEAGRPIEGFPRDGARLGSEEITALSRCAVRTFDIVVALVALILCAPLLLVIGVTVRLTSEGPAIFTSQRFTRNHRQFRMYKFRTMVEDAEAGLAAYLDANPEAKEEWDRNHKLARDPRLTPVGRVLRRTSLDELPQFLNVLIGQMSVVGPRPLTVAEHEDFGAFADEIASVKTGITGAWQIGGRNLLSFEERIPLDLDYVRDRTLWGDIGITARTVLHVIKGCPGAF